MLFILGIILVSILSSIFGGKSVGAATAIYALATKDEKLLATATLLVAVSEDKPTSDSASASPELARPSDTDSKT